MISNFFITPQAGTVQDAQNITLTSNYRVEKDNTRIRIENVAHKTNAIFLDNNSKYYSLQKEKSDCSVEVNLNLTEHSSQLAISLFIYVEVKEGDEYKVVDLQSLIYYVKEESISFDGDLNLSPMFAGPNDLCNISVRAGGDNKYIFSINDKRYIVLTNTQGKGSIHFRGNDFLTQKEEESVKRFPVYYYDSKSNYTKKVFSGLYIHYLPADIKAAADEQVVVDPRCTLITDTGWIPPEECLKPPTGDPGNDIVPGIPPGPPTKPEECDIGEVLTPSSCKISSSDFTMLYNGLALHSFVSVDSNVTDKTSDEFNVPRVFISKDSTSLEVESIAQRDVIVGPKSIEENFDIYVDDDLWNLLEDFQNNNYKVIFNNDVFGYQSFDLIEKKIDPYRNLNILVASSGSVSVRIDNFLFCVNAVFYNDNTISPDILDSLPFIEDSFGKPISVIMSSIGSNSDFVGKKEDNIAYVVAEAFNNGESQLYLYSFFTDKDLYLSNNFGWFQLTEEGSNKNPKVIVDTLGSLHVFWESNRLGDYQIYYGVLGPSAISRGNAVLSSILDKHAELLQRETKPFLYFSGKLLIPAAGDEYDIIPRYDTSALLGSNEWLLSNTGSAIADSVPSSNALDNLNIRVNAFNDSALAFVVLEQENIIEEGLFDQYSYQIDFNLQSTLVQTDELLNDWEDKTLTTDEVDNLFDTWKSKFILEIDDNFSNIPVYVFSDNKFQIGRKDNIYDAIIPVLGAYKETNPSAPGDFEIRFIRENAFGTVSNVRHFVLAVMLEKSVFKATNAQFPFEYCSESGQSIDDCDGYIPEEKHTIYTGRAKLALLLKNDSIKTSEDDISEYTIVREFPKSFSIHELHNFNILINYAKMFHEDAADFMDQFVHEEHTRFVCNVKIIMDDSLIFGESFVVDLSEKYRKFDIAFGVPTGGGYVTDKMIPHRLSIYDNIETIFDFTDIFITSPKLRFDKAFVSVPANIFDEPELFSYDNNDKSEDETVSFSDNFNLLSLAFDDDKNILNPSIKEPYSSSTFLQVPLTFDGINISPSVCLGKCNDIHLVWQSNRNRYWDIFYTNSILKGLPFRLETQITNTKSNSIMPAVSVNQNGNRMIVWHDNRNGNFDIFSARSLEGYTCTKAKCQFDLFDNFGEGLDTCILSFPFVATQTGLYHFNINFYSDNNLTNLFKTISTSDSITGWTIDGVDFSDLCVTVNLTCDGVKLLSGTKKEIGYVVQPIDRIFDKILYYKLTFAVE